MSTSPANALGALLIAATFAMTATPATAAPIHMQDTEVREFIRWYAEETATPLAIDPRVDGTLTVYAPDVPDHQLADFVHGVLRAHGYVIEPGNPPTVTLAGDTPPDFTHAIAVPQEPQATHVIPFDHVRASDIAPLITAYLNQSATGSMTPTHAQVLHAANAVLVNGPASRLDQLQAVLPQFDVAHPQVLIQSIIFETTDGDSLDLGVAFGSSRNNSTIAGGFNTNALGTSLSLPGGSFGIFDGNVLALAINALQRDSTARVLSTPQILTLSGQQGSISVGQNVPFITGRVTGESADVNNPFQTIERRDIGIRLNVRPVVTASGLIVMDVLTSADSLSDSLMASDIITNQRAIDTTVQIQSGQTVLLGGLVSEEDRQQESSVPGISRIPGVGRAFRSTSSSTQHRKLYVLLQATVLPIATHAAADEPI